MPSISTVSASVFNWPIVASGSTLMTSSGTVTLSMQAPIANGVYSLSSVGNGQTANTLVFTGSNFTPGASLLVEAVTELSPIPISLGTLTSDLIGSISSIVSVTNSSVQTRLPMLGGITWNYNGSQMAVSCVSPTEFIQIMVQATVSP